MRPARVAERRGGSLHEAVPKLVASLPWQPVPQLSHLPIVLETTAKPRCTGHHISNVVSLRAALGPRMVPKLLAQGMAIGVGDESRAESRGPAFGTAGRAHRSRGHTGECPSPPPWPQHLLSIHPVAPQPQGAPAGLGVAPPPCPCPQRQAVLGEGPPGKTSKCFTIWPFPPTLPQLWALGMGGV